MRLPNLYLKDINLISSFEQQTKINLITLVDQAIVPDGRPQISIQEGSCTKQYYKHKTNFIYIFLNEIYYLFYLTYI